jgi:XRE family transcriptional regulator, regulator of sulfur utilization
MKFCDKIIEARHRLGITQEELADMAKVNVRTIQRIEKGNGVPRAYTIKAIASALNLNLSHRVIAKDSPIPTESEKTSKSNFVSIPICSPLEIHEDNDFLRLLCLSCFSFLVLPWIHFSVPAYMLKKKKNLKPDSVLFGKRLIKSQLYWAIILNILLLATLGYNVFQTNYMQSSYFINYLWTLFGMYFINILMIGVYLTHVNSRKGQT